MTNLEQLDPADYRRVVADFRTMFSAHHTTRRVPGLSGVNFMTDDVLGNVTDAGGDVVEVSTGMFSGRRIFGISYSPGDPRSRMVDGDTLAAVHAALYGSGDAS